MSESQLHNKLVVIKYKFTENYEWISVSAFEQFHEMILQ